MDGSGNKNPIENNIFSREYKFSSANPFGADFNPAQTPQENPTSGTKRINGYDSTILNKTKFDDAEEENLSIEYRIKEKESAIKDLDSKIKAADTYGTQNEALGLKAKRQRLSQELNSLRRQQMYGIQTSGEKFSHEKFKRNMPVIYKIQRFISHKILARLSKKINSVVTLTDSLEQLSEISRSVDELIEMNTPYGEKTKNYEKLTAYLNQANLIHSKISKSLGKRV
ncbi:hypothetical protein IKR55_01665 [bacterium]|nr:hypothetical protein [bacterium]